MNISEIKIRPTVQTVPQEWIDNLYQKQQVVIQSMGSKWLLHSDKAISKQPIEWRLVP